MNGHKIFRKLIIQVCYFILFFILFLVINCKTPYAYNNNSFDYRSSNPVDTTLLKDLLKLEDIDQQYRNDIDSVISNYGQPSKEWDIFIKNMIHSDS